MLLAVEKGCAHVHHGITHEHALFHSLPDTFFDRGAVTMRDDATDDAVDELETAPPRQRFDLNPANAILPMAAALLNMTALSLGRLPNRLPIGDSRLSQRHAYTEFALHALAGDIQVGFPQP